MTHLYADPLPDNTHARNETNKQTKENTHRSGLPIKTKVNILQFIKYIIIITISFVKFVQENKIYNGGHLKATFTNPTKFLIIYTAYYDLMP